MAFYTMRDDDNGNFPDIVSSVSTNKDNTGVCHLNLFFPL